MKPRPRVSREHVARLARASGVTALFLASLCLATLAHLNTAPVRSCVAYVLNAALRQVFVGELRVQGIEKLSFEGARLKQVEVIDPSGTSVVALNGASVDWSAIVNLMRVVRSGNQRWVLDQVRVESARVRLRNDPTTGILTLVQALTLRSPPRATSETPGREVQVWLPAVEISDVSVRFDAADLAAFTPRFVGVHGRLQVRSDGVSVDVQRFGTTVTGMPGAELHGTGTFALRSGASLRGTFAGFVGNVEVQASAQYNDEVLKVVVDAPRVTPGAARALWPAWPLLRDAELRATVEGNLPTLSANLTAETERTTLEATGSLVLNPLRLHLDIDAAGLDLLDWIDGAPRTSIDSTASFDLEQRDVGFTFDLAGATSTTRVLDVSVPKLSYHVRGDPATIALSLGAHEPGAEISLEATLAPAAERIEATWKIQAVDLARQRRIPGGFTGKASLSGQLALREGRLQMSAIADLNGFRFGDFSAQSGKLNVSTEGPWQLLEEAKFRGSFVGHRVALGSLAFTTAKLKVNGSRHAANTELELTDPDGRSARLRGVVMPDFSMRDVHAALERGALRATADIASLNLERQTVDVARLQVVGPQINLEGRFRYAPELLDGALHGTGVSLSRLAHLVGLSSLPVTGTADVNAEVTIGPGLQRGSFEAQLHDVSVGQFGRSEIEFNAVLRDETLVATLDGKDAVAGPFGGSIEATLAGPPLRLDSYRDAVGTADLEVREVPLEVLGLLIPEAIASNLEGRVGVRLQLQRPKSGALPVAYLQVGVSGASGLVPKVSAEPLSGLGALATGNYDPEARRLNLSLALSDSLGLLATSSTQLTVDIQELLGGAAPALDILRSAPLNITVDLPTRALAGYPLEATRKLRGTLGAHLTLDGSLADPTASIVANVNELTSFGFSAQTPVSVTFNGLHAPRSGQTQLFISGVLQGSSVIRGELTGTLPWLAVENPPWQADAKLTLDALPLERLAPLQALGITGSTSGVLTWTSSSAVPLDARLTFDKLGIGMSPLGTGDLRLSGGSKGITGRFDLKHDQSSLAVDLITHGTLHQLEAWNDLDRVEVRVVASALNAAILSPFLDTLLARLGGKLDAQVQIALVRAQPAPGAASTWRTTFDGTASLTQGTGYIDALGLELQDVSATAKTARFGALTQLQLSDVRAKARSEQVNLRALSNLNFDGIRLASGNVSASLQEVPLTLQGINLGRATGKAKAVLKRMAGWDGPPPLTGSEYLDVAITLQDFRLHTTSSASRGLIDLNPNQDILVAQRPPAERAVGDLLPYRFHINLGDDVRVMLTDQEVPLGGTIGIDLAGDPQFFGQVILKPGGRLLVLGRVFEVVNGTVRFNPRDASNPDLNLALSGRGIDGNTVYVSVVGTLQEPITDPPPAKLQELLGGGTATAVSGGMQALGLGSLLGSSFQLRVSDSDPGESVPSYSAAVKIDEDLWFEANYQNEGDGLSQKDSAALSGTLDYRFQDNWSLRTKVGTTSGSLDLSWQYRY